MTLTKSAKLKGMPGVVGPKPSKPASSNVDIIEEGSVVAFSGSVDGGNIRAFIPEEAGEGDAARRMRRSAPSSPVCAFVDVVLRVFLRDWAEWARWSDGVLAVRDRKKGM